MKYEFPFWGSVYFQGAMLVLGSATGSIPEKCRFDIFLKVRNEFPTVLLCCAINKNRALARNM